MTNRKSVIAGVITKLGFVKHKEGMKKKIDIMTRDKITLMDQEMKTK